ncbi:MAG: RNA polymerase factor sigma-54 [Caulobacter sp.]|nr:RNA polymerase factor sigma-54 [Caulobacter sp.]
MALGPRLELRQGQGLVITPQLQQAIKLLQLTNLELEVYVEGELERNPLLQRDERDSENDPEPTRAETADYAVDNMPDSAAQADMDAGPQDLSPGERDAGDGDTREPAEQAGGQVDWSKAGRGGSFEGEDSLEGRLSRDKTLGEHLHDQLAVAGLTAPERVVAAVLIDGVDEGGYMRLDLDEVAERLGCELSVVNRVLTVLQGFEPTGIMARDVRECLSIQLRERDRLDPAMAILLDNLELLARRDLTALKRACGVDDEDMREMIAELKALTPRPGAAFGGEPSQPVIPDVFVREGSGGLWHVELNSDTLPKVLVDRRYHARVNGGARTDAEKTFVSDCLANANWLVKSLDQRARTILKVSGEIVRQQDGFLAFGVQHLRPLNLKTVADAIGMHESTVSRVTSNKYIATPRGVFELKFFFTSSIASSLGGEAHSAEAVRHRIRVLIDAEGAESDVHSDDAIVDILKEAGVDIARRTVAKYREAMRIPSSVERRRMLRAAV